MKEREREKERIKARQKWAITFIQQMNTTQTSYSSRKSIFLSFRCFEKKFERKEKKNDCNKTKWQIKTISEMNLTFSLCSAKQF
jgi:phage shock protein A